MNMFESGILPPHENRLYKRSTVVIFTRYVLILAKEAVESPHHTLHLGH